MNAHEVLAQAGKIVLSAQIQANHDEYTRRELFSFAKDLEAIRCAPLSHRREDQETFRLSLIDDPTMVKSYPKISWLLDGTCGFGCMIYTRNLLSSQGATRWRKVLEVFGAVHFNCPEVRTAAILRGFGDKLLTTIRLAVEESLERWEEVQAQQDTWDREFEETEQNRAAQAGNKSEEGSK